MVRPRAKRTAAPKWKYSTHSKKPRKRGDRIRARLGNRPPGRERVYQRCPRGHRSASQFLAAGNRPSLHSRVCKEGICLLWVSPWRGGATVTDYRFDDYMIEVEAWHDEYGDEHVSGGTLPCQGGQSGFRGRAPGSIDLGRKSTPGRLSKGAGAENRVSVGALLNRPV